MCRKVLLVLALAASFVSCERDMDAPLSSHKSFVPAELGKYIIYDVDSFIWDDFSKTLTTKKSQMKYEYTDTFTDGEGRLTYVVTITRKDDTSDVFVEDNVATLTINERNVEFLQKGFKFIPFIFPVKNGDSWDGLAFINRADPANPQFSSLDWKFEFKNVDKSYTVGGNTFDKTVTVEHIDLQINDPFTEPEYYAEKTRSYEVYADKIGLIYKEYTYWVYQPINGFPKGVGVKMSYSSSNW